MKRAVMMAAAIVLLTGPAMASTCNLVVNGKSLWHGTCAVRFNEPGISLSATTTAAMSCHANGGSKKCTYEEVCAGPHVNIFPKSPDNEIYESDWNTGNSCHGEGFAENVKKVGPNTYRGDGYLFTAE